MVKNIYRFIVAMASVAFLISCEPSTYVGIEIVDPGSSTRPEADREYNVDVRNVLLLYSAGFNSLSEYLKDDMKDLLNGNLHSAGRMSDVLLIYSHLPTSYGKYNVPTSPVLMRVYKDADDAVVKDTLVVYPDDTRSASAAQLNKVLTYVKDNYHAKSYGMIFSSHATGYLPLGYYSNPDKYVYTPVAAMCGVGEGYDFPAPVGVPYVEPEHDPSLPMVKSVGQDQVGVYGSYTSYEIEIGDFARALPADMPMDYILFDACLMGGVEVAYELVGRCGKVGFSQTEVLAEGFDYRSLTSHLLNGGEPDPESVCRDYFRQYENNSGYYQSATISLVDCMRMEPLAEICSVLFSKYRAAINTLTKSQVQRYYRGNCHWFFDLEDILDKAGADEDELKALNEALESCILYKAATDEFMLEFQIRDYSGLSMYLPSQGDKELDRYYRTLRWNVATGLVE